MLVCFPKDLYQRVRREAGGTNSKFGHISPAECSEHTLMSVPFSTSFPLLPQLLFLCMLVGDRHLLLFLVICFIILIIYLCNFLWALHHSIKIILFPPTLTVSDSVRRISGALRAGWGEQAQGLRSRRKSTASRRVQQGAGRHLLGGVVRWRWRSQDGSCGCTRSLNRSVELCPRRAMHPNCSQAAFSMCGCQWGGRTERVPGSSGSELLRWFLLGPCQRKRVSRDRIGLEQGENHSRQRGLRRELETQPLTKQDMDKCTSAKARGTIGFCREEVAVVGV